MPSYPVCDRSPVSALSTFRSRAYIITHYFERTCYVNTVQISYHPSGNSILSTRSVQHYSKNHHTRKFVVQTTPILHAMPNSIHCPHHNTILPVRGHNGRRVARETRSAHSLRSLGDSSCPSPCNRCPFRPRSAFRPWVLLLRGLVLMLKGLLGVPLLVRPFLSWSEGLS